MLDLRSGRRPNGGGARPAAPPRPRLILSPAEFLPHVERTPVIRALTLHVVAEALNHAKVWRDRGHEIGVSVNVPYRTLDDAELIEGLAGLTAVLLPAAGLLTLEVVPSGPGAGAELDQSALSGLAAIGVRLSLDDFGRASSLTALRQLPLDEVKIDAHFVHAIDRHRADSAVVSALVDLAHQLDLEVVAEGVESRETWYELCRIGCDLRAGVLHRGTHVRREAHPLARAQLAGRGRAGFVGEVTGAAGAPERLSHAPSIALAVRARMKSRSERRFR